MLVIHAIKEPGAPERSGDNTPKPFSVFKPRGNPERPGLFGIHSINADGSRVTVPCVAGKKIRAETQPKFDAQPTMCKATDHWRLYRNDAPGSLLWIRQSDTVCGHVVACSMLLCACTEVLDQVIIGYGKMEVSVLTKGGKHQRLGHASYGVACCHQTLHIVGSLADEDSRLLIVTRSGDTFVGYSLSVSEAKRHNLVAKWYQNRWRKPEDIVRCIEEQS